MAAKDRKTPSFDDMIKEGRARKKNETLAAEIFGRNRNNKAASNKNNRSGSNSPSLASRGGVAKRSSSSASNSSPRNPFRPPVSRNASTQSQRDRTNRLTHAMSSDSSNAPRPQQPSGLSIKGKAGPWTIVASNFAPGTTAADIQTTLSRDAFDSDGQNGLLSCEIIATRPMVSAELVVSERTIADRIISTYNNQLADNRYLKLSYQKQPPPPSAGFIAKNTAPAPEAVPAPEEPAFLEDTDMMPVDDLEQPQPKDTHRYDDEREAAAASRDRRDRESRRDERDDDRNSGRREEGRDRRYEDRSYDRRYDEQPRYDSRPSYGRGDGRGEGRGYGGGVRGSYARAAGMAGSGGGGPRGHYRGGHR